MHHDILGLTALPLPQVRRRTDYRVGPLRSRSELPAVTIGASIRNGAFSSLAVVAALGIPVFLVLGAKAPMPQSFANPPSEEVAKVWSEPEPVAAPLQRTVEAPPMQSPAPPPAEAPVAKAPEPRSALSLDLIPVLDDESGDLAIEEAMAAIPPPPKPPQGRAASTAPRPTAPARQ